MEDSDYILMTEIIYRLSHEIKLLKSALAKSRHAQEDLATAHKRKTDRAFWEQFKASSRYEVLDIRPQIGMSRENNAVLLTLSTPYDTSIRQRTAESRIRREAPVELAKYFKSIRDPNFIITPDARSKIYVITMRLPYEPFSVSFEQDEEIPDLYSLNSRKEQQEALEPVFSQDLDVDKDRLWQLTGIHAKNMENTKEPAWSERADFIQVRLEEILEARKIEKT